MKRITDVRDFFIFGNVWLALCAVAQGLLTYRLLRVDYSFSVVAILFLATFFIYNFRVLFNKDIVEKHKEERTSGHMRWMAYHAKLLSALSIVSLVAMIPFVLGLKGKTIVVFFIVAVLALAYALPLFTKSTGLRHLPGLKTFLVALVWTLSTVLIPVVESGVAFAPLVLKGLLIKRFILLFTLALVFDIRDEQTDKENELHTIATYFGSDKTRKLCLILLLIELTLIYCYDYTADQRLCYAFMLYTLLVAAVVWGGKYNRSIFYYFFLVDGMMVLQYYMVNLAF
ncbi:MAG TPA: hypothetical protein VK750_01065 [Cytophagaceae bacterium]|nr:hypothetical protein [Cytophagaceae bacterium]